MMMCFCEISDFSLVVQIWTFSLLEELTITKVTREKTPLIIKQTHLLRLWSILRTDVIQRRFVNTMILCHVNFIPGYFKAGWHINTNYGDFSHVTVKKLKMGRVPIGICFLKSK